MCGHVGIAGNLTSTSMKVFKNMLFFDEVRGRDGTGVATIPFRGDRTPEDLSLIKYPFKASTCLDNKPFNDLASNPQAGVVIGHNRAATQGKLTVSNTHPFHRGTIVGAHNGTVSSANRNLDIEGTFGTDSESIIESIHKNGIKSTIGNMTSCAYGAWALVWYDFTTNELNFLRNEYRPFHYCKTKDGKQLLWASEAGIIMAAAFRHKLEIDKIYSLPVDKLYTWTVPEDLTGVFGTPQKESCAGKKPKTHTTTNTPQRDPWKGAMGYGGRGARTANTSVKLPSSFDEPLKDYTGITTSDVVSMFKTNHECAWCGTEVTQKDVDNGGAVIIARDTVVCEKHSKLPIVANAVAARLKKESA